MIGYIADYVEESGVERLPSPWLPPLSERIYLPELMERDYRTNWQEPNQALAPVIGMGDFPEQQAQEMISIPLAKDGHLLVISSPGYGKSTFLQTVVLDLARTHNPSRFHVYLLDFGTNGLLPLKGLPHVADTMLIDEEEKVGKLLRRMMNEMKSRKKKLSDYGVASLEMYEKASGEEVPSILVVLDNYDAVREAAFSEAFEATMSQIAREGASIGIHLVLSAGRQNALRIPLLSNIKTQIALYMIDQSDVRSIVGRTDLKLEETPGRGLIKLAEPALFQTALPTKGEDELQLIAAIQAEAKAMDEAWIGEKPEPIPMMPEEAISFERFKQMKATQQLLAENILPLGLEFENVTPLPFDIKKQGNLIAVADRPDQQARMLKALAQNLSLLSIHFQTMILDTSEEMLATIGKGTNAYLSTPDQLVAVKNDLLAEIANRLENKTDGADWIIFIASLKDFCAQTMVTEEEMNTLFHATQAGVYLIVCSEYSYLGQSFEPVPKYIRSQAVAGVLGMRLSDQDIFKQPYMSNEKSPEPYECYFTMEQHHVKMKIPE